ncbi:MAG: hypothetical protein KF887_10530 [Paracoccaceae bacterium]|nr:MAG: hypothetical protein KF887_10530 [Paracoccaceae bacterium]
MTEPPSLTYPGAPASLIARWQSRRSRMALAEGEALPDPRCDLAAMAATPAAPPAPLPEGASMHARKAAEVRGALQGHSELAVLNGLLIAHLRKRRAPRGTAALFRRIWVEQGPALIAELPGRWLVSSAITFGDHGLTEGERSLGREVNVLFSLIKLYEHERLQGGLAPDAARMRNAHPGPLPLGMEPFSLLRGGLDINLLAPIWERAESEPVLGPLVVALMERLNADPGTIFRRLATLRERRRARRAP